MLPRGLKIPPKLTQNRPKIAPWSTLGPPGGTKILFRRFGIDFGPQFGPPWDPKIDQKSILCEKNAQRSALSNQCLPGAVHHLSFYTFFWSFLVKKRWKNHHVVVLLAGISHPWKTMYFTGYPACGQCFCKYAEILEIWQKKRKKTWKNEVLILLAKSSQKASPRHPKSTPNRPFWEQKSLKIAKIVEKSEFSQHWFFERKKEAKKAQKRSPTDWTWPRGGTESAMRNLMAQCCHLVLSVENWCDHAVISCCAWELTLEAWSLRL